MTPELASRYQLSGYKHEATNNLVPFSIMAKPMSFPHFGRSKTLQNYYRRIWRLRVSSSMEDPQQ